VRVAVGVEVWVAVGVALGGWKGVLVKVGVEVEVGTGGVPAGWSFGSPGKVNAIISCRLVQPSPSESRFSMAAKAAELRPAAL
jgi:hypothetical protein